MLQIELACRDERDCTKSSAKFFISHFHQFSSGFLYFFVLNPDVPWDAGSKDN